MLVLFTVGLEMRPAKIWSMRRLLFGLGSSQVLITAAAIAVYFYLVANHHWQNAVIVGLASSMSSTAIIMATLGERGELASKHGQARFSVLMAQGLWIVPVMALAITLHTFYPQLNIYLRVPSLDYQDEMVAQGIKHATTSYIESTLAKGGQLLMDVGVSEIDVNELTASIRQDNYALIRA